MKPIIPLLSTLLVSSLCAEGMLTYHYGHLTTESTEILAIQSLGEIVGGNSPYHEIRYGVSALNSLGATKADAYLFGYNAPDKNNETGIGIGGALHGSISSSIPQLTWKIAGNAGYGWQDVKGKTAMISTNINKFSYIVSSSGYDRFRVPTKMKYEDDTYVLTLSLATGISYDINVHWRIDSEFTYRSAYYQFAYRNEGSGILNALTTSQDQWISTVGITYRY